MAGTTGNNTSHNHSRTSSPPLEAISKRTSPPVTDDNLAHDTLGLAVPGMPHGSPGMATGRQDDYKVFAFTANGETEVFQNYSF